MLSLHIFVGCLLSQKEKERQNNELHTFNIHWNNESVQVSRRRGENKIKNQTPRWI